MLNRRIRIALIAALVCVSASIVPSDVTAQDSPVLDRIVETSTLRVGMSGSQPPFNMKARDGALMGLEVDLANALAAAMKVELQLVEKPFADLLPALEAGEVDMVLSGMTITADRSRSVSFVGPYVISGKSILTKSSTLAAVQEAGDLNESDIRLVVLANSTSETFVRTNLPEAQLTTVASYDEAIEMLRADETGALIADMPICLLTVMRFPNEGFATLNQPLTLEPIGIAVPANDEQLQNLVRNYVTALEGTGILDALRQAWLENGAWVAALP
ncbi:MAG: transporter substrate-binding domain-containing protein, partial [Gemmatimonadetes bacterium]|nr:transporter substrate-binding domain-containing protein [Gemmatimonadota bacterium]